MNNTNETTLTGTNRNGDLVTMTFEKRDLGFGIVVLVRNSHCWKFDGVNVTRNAVAGRGVVRLLSGAVEA